MKLFPPPVPLLPVTFLPLRVQNFICVTPTVTNYYSSNQAKPVTIALSTLLEQIIVFEAQSWTERELLSSRQV